ncbi:ATP-binding protein [Polaribacter sp.]|uniref:sensor histidine kinase n=1 Tax=Polaribacter sp. TaxID=1920175 RepID=UPI003EF1102E
MLKIKIFVVLGFILLLPIFSFAKTTSAFSQKKDSAFYYYKKGLEHSYNNHADLAYIHFLKSLELYKNTGNNDSVSKCNLQIFTLLDAQENNKIKAIPFLKEYELYNKKINDTIGLLITDAYYASHYFNYNFSKSEFYYKKGLHQARKLGLDIFEAGFSTNLGTLYNHYDTLLHAKYHVNAITIYKKNNLNNKLFSSYLNFAEYFYKKNDFSKAIAQLKNAEGINPDKYNAKMLSILYGRLSVNYQKNNQYKKANEYYLKSDSLEKILNNTQQNIAISDIKEKYDNQKLRADNLEIEQQRQQNRNFLIGALLFILLAGTIAILSLKNSKRKRKLAEQETALETQKNLTILKEQELTTINAMVDGQEKERKRIAEDLHDNLGSVLATLKMHFENLKINNEKKKISQEILFDKTEGLIDEAYLKVRSIAHAKNAGVIANQGLLVAVKMMAEKISSADKITIEVIHFGLNKRLENSLEISVFRIIQELITNIIKHADAKNATINLSLFDKNLNIIIEDDGKGFDIKKVNLKNGMGISSIKTRVSHLKGTFKVDATLGKGSSIIINVPVS